MKRLFALLLAALMLAGSAAADPVDLSGLSFDQLVALRDQLNLAIWNSKEWQEVTVPAGVWTVGEDIPIAHWSISVSPDSSTQWVSLIYCDLLDKSGLGAGNQFDCNIYSYQTIGGPENDRYPQKISIDLKPNTYIIIEHGSVIFTPYSGKPDLGFK
jgi:hypothetical protein